MFDLLDDFGIGRTSDSVPLPRVNIMKTGTDYRFEMAIPGMKEEDFGIGPNNKTLIVQSERSLEAEVGSLGSYTQHEFGYSAFRRSFDLPNTVKSERIKARYLDGILTIVVPKHEEVRQKPPRSIEIF